MRVTVPTTLADNEYESFPEGFYDGEIEGAQLRDPNDDGSWLSLRLTLGNVAPKEGTDDPGRSRFSGDITIKTDGVEVTEVQDFSNSDLHFGIRRAGGLLAGLAEGLGVATRDAGGIDFDPEALIEALLDGQFEGESVGFEVSHYSPKDSDKVYDQFNRFGPAS